MKFENLKGKLKSKVVIVGAVTFVLGIIFSPCIEDHTDTGLQDKYNNLVALSEKKDSEINELNAKLEEAEPWFAMKEDEQKALEEQKLAEEKAKQEEADRLAQEAASIGYDTGITYDQLARTPDDYLGNKIKFNGKVVQVLEGDGEVEIRLAVDGDYDKIVYCAYDSSIVSSRVLEGDNITAMGVSAGLLSYQSTMGGTITIPSMLIEQINQ